MADQAVIDGFDGENAFLSNFLEHTVHVPPLSPLMESLYPDGVNCRTTEHGFHAAKCIYKNDLTWVLMASSPREAKRRGRQVALRPDWEQVKDGVMLSLQRAKFAPGTLLGERLLATGASVLVERNRWGDVYWGTDLSGNGENRLGRLIMQVRDELQNQDPVRFLTEKSQMDKAAALDGLYNDYATTLVLQEVSHGQRLVRGCGPLDSPLVVVGEAPGAQEAEQGRPFVGPSGRLLQKLFADAGLPWDLCYVMNVLPWRPPGNRTPYPYEIIASYGRVRDEIAIIDPRAVVMAGATAWHAVTQNDYGHFSEHHGHDIIAPPAFPFGLVCVRHPGALLRASGTDRAKMEAETVRALKSLMAAADA